jgi:hypothetical protein
MTPKYLGNGQPASSSCDGPLAWLDSLFGIFGGGGTPSYVGAGQPAPTGSVSDGSVYRKAPAGTRTPTADDLAVPEPCPLPDPFGSYIVIPRRE